MTESEVVSIVCRLTGTAPAAIGVLGIRGPRAHAQVMACFLPRGKPANTLPLGRIRLGRWHGGRPDRPSPERSSAVEPVASEEVVVCAIAAECVEVHGHGGPAAIAALMDDLVRHGARVVSEEEWLRSSGEAWLERRARQVLQHATTARTAQFAVEQLNGRLREALDQLLQSAAQGDAARVEGLAAQLLERAPVGEHLDRPWRIALVGPPNVGKSSLFNALLGYTRAIVSARAGTTRDVVRAQTAVDGWPIELQDTAGVRATDDEIEQQAIDRAHQARQQADLRLAVVDCQQGLVDAHRPFAQMPAVIWVWNKSDMGNPPASSSGEAGGTDLVTNGRQVQVSARTGEGLDRLLVAIGNRLVPHPPPPGAAIPLDRQIIERLHAALSIVRAADRPRGWAADLQRLLGPLLSLQGPTPIAAVERSIQTAETESANPR